MFGEVLTPSQRVSTAEPAPQRRYSLPKIDAVSINAHFGDYMCIVEKKKDFKAKA